jgi:hypothetical protein
VSLFKNIALGFLLFIASASSLAAEPVTCTQNLTPGSAEIKALLPNPCLGVAKLTSEEIEKTFDPFFKSHIITTKRKLTVWRQGYRTPQYPNGTPAGVYDSSTPLLSDFARKHPSGTSADYEGPVNPKKNSTEIFKKLTGAAAFSHDDHGKWGGGMYLAADPLSSLDYFHGSLIRVEVPAGIKLLSLKDEERDMPVSDDLYLKTVCEKESKFFGPVETWNATTIAGVIARLGALKSGRNTIEISDLEHFDQGREALQHFFDQNGVAGLSASWTYPPFLSCTKVIPSNDSGRMIVLKDQEPRKKVKTRLMVDTLERKPSHQKEKLYREAMDYFEAFDFSSCKKFAEGNRPELCSEGDQASGDDIHKAFWKIYRGWAEHFYYLDQSASQEDLEKLRQEKFAAMPEAKKEKIASQDYGCQKSDWEK